MSDVNEKVDKIVEEESHIWKTRSAFLAYLRGGIRRGLWMKHPLKLEVLNERRHRIPNPNPKNRERFPEVWGAKCECCGGLFKTSDVEVDHKRDKGVKFTSIEDMQKFIEELVIIRREDLRVVCKPCHKVISHAQNKGLTFEEAFADKEAIKFTKSIQTLVDKLSELGVNSNEIPRLKADKISLLKRLIIEKLKETK